MALLSPLSPPMFCASACRASKRSIDCLPAVLLFQVVVDTVFLELVNNVVIKGAPNRRQRVRRQYMVTRTAGKFQSGDRGAPQRVSKTGGG